jgi:hypothetical protein
MSGGMLGPARNLAIRAHFGADKSALALPTLYFALFKGSPVGSGVEPTSFGGYARLAMTNDDTLWGTYTTVETAVTNKGSAGALTWPASTDIWSQNPVDHWAIFDNSAGGVLWYWGPLAGPLTLTGAGDVIQLPPSTLTISQAG